MLATVCYGAVVEARALRERGRREKAPSSTELAEVLRTCSVDLLFRCASSALASGAAPKVRTAKKSGLLYSAEELEAAIHSVRPGVE